MKKSNFQYECAINLQQYVQMKGFIVYKKRQSFLVFQPCFDLKQMIMGSKHLKKKLMKKKETKMHPKELKQMLNNNKKYKL